MSRAICLKSASSQFCILLHSLQRWNRGHKARGQGHKKNLRPRTALPRTDTLEAKDKDTSASALQEKKSSQKFFRQSPEKKFFFQALHKTLTIQKLVLPSSQGQANF